MEFVGVKSVEKKDYKGPVYDIGVNTDHTYTINDYSVHNSAAGSLITYLIGITNVDPIKHDLMFERFLDPARDDLPDIDTDFEPRIRDAVVDYMITRFGRDNTANIGTYGMLKTKSAILDVARVFGIPASETMNVTKFLNIDSEGDSLKEVEDLNPELKKYLDKWQDKGYNLRFFIEGIRGSVRQPSMHAAGLLVSNVNLAENLALMRAKKGIITAWQESGNLQELSDLGFAKMDILGLQNLQVMNDAAKLVKERHGVEIDWSKVDLDDPDVYKNIIQTGDAMGLFQFEAGFVINMLRNIKPRNFEQFAAISALLRPGPLHMGMDKEFARRVNGLPDDSGHVWKEEDIPEPIRDILVPTVGILCIEGSSLVLTNEGLLPIEDIVNERMPLKVLTMNEDSKEYEWKVINNWYDNGIKELIELDFGETKIQCTPDHEIYTNNRGWVEAQNLTEDDEVVFNKK